MNWDGLVLINKPADATSHTVVQMVKQRLGVSKAGHLGTLDPLATGVFPVCLGRSTRLSPFYMGADKCYIAQVGFGFFTATDDREGEQEGPRRKPLFSRDQLNEAILSFQGEYNQKPPFFSAKKVRGKKAYELARKGIRPELAVQKVMIHEIQLVHYENDAAVIYIHCGSGTYVRSIARELGTILHCGAHVTELTRTRFSQYSVEQTCSPDAPIEKLSASFIPIEKMLSHLPEFVIDPELGRKILAGSAINIDPRFDQEWVRIFSSENTLLALAQVETQKDGQRLQPKIVFN